MIRYLTAAVLAAIVPCAALAQDGDAAAGEKVFRKCQACHAVGEGAENKVGPALNGIVGRTIASGEGFDYSDVLAEMGSAGKTWTPEELGAFLTKPRDYAKGTKMSFAGLRKEDERADVIAYLATFAGS
ncbi:cytochrome c family protein [Meridianimarinicoccus roseus]|jgi:cytochrome c|uniref:Cytochrome c family protein n=1 Tax=Meridianimarinicoccus roseus TaxID=2072018 RepID=A0A2V2LL16_9RHOB|nr:cytochrome c family protein [Meridianimarinicoccus roseus]PWR04264.1 cytochrome c family protein [Meridianimarinicoccus roseus]